MVVIIGGGIVGASVAYYLSSQQHHQHSKLTIVDSVGPAACSSGRAGAFLAGSWGDDGNKRQALFKASFSLHEKLSKELDLQSFRKLASFQVDLENEDDQSGEEPASHQDPWLSDKHIHHQPLKGPSAVVDPSELTLALFERVVLENGGDFRKLTVKGFETSGSRVSCMSFQDGTSLEIDNDEAVVIAIGPWSSLFEAARQTIALDDGDDSYGSIRLEVFPSAFSDKDETRFANLAEHCQLLIACERAGPGKDGKCYTMRGIDMNEKGLIAPLDRLVKECNAPFLAIGDGGNELGMGKVIENIVHNPKISNGDKIGCVVAADHLIAASVSNWGGYALASAVALAHVQKQSLASSDIAKWIERCVPTEQDEIALLDKCVAAGCRDGVSGKMEATVDGMPLETSLQCLRDIRKAALLASNT